MGHDLSAAGSLPDRGYTLCPVCGRRATAVTQYSVVPATGHRLVTRYSHGADSPAGGGAECETTHETPR